MKKGLKSLPVVTQDQFDILVNALAGLKLEVRRSGQVADLVEELCEHLLQNTKDATEYCKEYLKNFRKAVGAKPEESIDKRGKTREGWKAPNDKYYNAHCGYCAEVEYLKDIHIREKLSEFR